MPNQTCSSNPLSLDPCFGEPRSINFALVADSTDYTLRPLQIYNIAMVAAILTKEGLQLPSLRCFLCRAATGRGRVAMIVSKGGGRLSGPCRGSLLRHPCKEEGEEFGGLDVAALWMLLGSRCWSCSCCARQNGRMQRFCCGNS
ncbi:MMPL family transporter [Sesbania bispinosa]|nr:MMPL family transporter [Sesbania bispinosa]